MKISMDDQEVLLLTETQKKVIKNDIPEDIFDEDMKRRLRYIVEQPAQSHINTKSQEWVEDLRKRNVPSIPVDKESIADLALQDVQLSAEENVENSVKVDDVELFKVKRLYKKIYKQLKAGDVNKEIADQLKYILTHKYERCFARLYNEWVGQEDENGLSKLARNGVTSIPTDPDALADLIFSQPNYKNRSQREVS